MLLIAALSFSAQAGEDACLQCCQAGGLPTCEPTLRVYGERSRLLQEGAGWRVVGVWDVGCDGRAVFDTGASVLLGDAPEGGELVMPAVNPLQVHCFQQACSLPAEICLSPPDSDGNYTLLGCADGLPASASQLSRPPASARSEAARVVVLDGKPLVVEPIARTGPPSTLQPAPTVSPTISPTAATPVAPTGGDPFTTFATTLPADPPETCKPPLDALRLEARKRVDLGDEKRMRKDPDGALQEYRAALSMDACNAYGWLGIGDVASELARPDLAIRALRNTTRILPGHYGAWTLLGKNYEAIRQTTLAAQAYKKALDLRPGQMEALDGWRRVTGG